MIFDLLSIIFIQPLVSSLFIFLGPLLYYYLSSNLKGFNLKIFLYSLLSDLLFIKPLGFFLLVTSFCLLLISILEKFVDYNDSYKLLLFFLVFNVFFLLSFLFLASFKFNLQFFLKLFIFNIIFQLIYIALRRIITNR